MSETIRAGDIPWDDCPHRLRIEERTQHMERLTEKMIDAVAAEVQAVSRDIKQEIRHQGELSGHQFDVIREEIQQVVARVRVTEETLSTFRDMTDRRLNKLEDAAGKAALNVLKWTATVLGTGGLTYVATRVFGG